MRAYRIADMRFPILDGAGAQLAGGRWNSPGMPVVYAAETFAGAVLEVLVHMGHLKMPKNRVYVELSIPEVLVSTGSVEEMSVWAVADPIASRRFGDQWLRTGDSPVLLVPSLVTQGVEKNLLINPRHPAFPEIKASASKKVEWDPRLFASSLG